MENEPITLRGIFQSIGDLFVELGVLFNRLLDADLGTFIGIIFWGVLILGVLWAI